MPGARHISQPSDLDPTAIISPSVARLPTWLGPRRHEIGEAAAVDDDRRGNQNLRTDRQTAHGIIITWILMLFSHPPTQNILPIVHRTSHFSHNLELCAVFPSHLCPVSSRDSCLLWSDEFLKQSGVFPFQFFIGLFVVAVRLVAV